MSSDAAARVRVLRSLSRRPDPHSDVREAILRLLEDRSPAVLLPVGLGEVRLAAAHACARLFALTGDARVVRVSDAPTIYAAETLAQIAESTGCFAHQHGPELFTLLRDDGHLPKRDRFFDPRHAQEELALQHIPLNQAIYEAASAGQDGHFIELTPGSLLPEP